MKPDPALVGRFRDDVEKLTGHAPERLGIAVSGGPDSLALLLLAAVAYPGRVEAATVDHGLRAESADEAIHVARTCAQLGVGHTILEADWAEAPTANIQAEARRARYDQLLWWANDKDIWPVATAHHLDDQAETLLMRLARGAGVPGLSAIRSRLVMEDDGDEVCFVRPLLGWRKQELIDLVLRAGLTPVDDRSNSDERFDRTAARALLASTPWLEPERLADAASHIAESDEALDWATRELLGDRLVWQQGPGGYVTIDASGVPRELQRRLLLGGFAFFIHSGIHELPGPKLDRLLEALRAGRTATLAGVKAMPGPPWRLTLAPPRRT
ncbi:MAG: tRNA lysidine(34) synthetase TilS [Allosphingosinicella sp.]|uniref:tRNA lysidine(34) synthetase TilS n=1 Tax=Allosphingosinicella sp. TaxID=2823234 RepID=UPI003934B1B8